MKALHLQFDYLQMAVLFIGLLQCHKIQNSCKKIYIHQICEWTSKWQMNINVDKCVVLRCAHSLTPIQYAYQLLDHFLDVKKLHTHLDLGIDNTMSWSSHVQAISNRSKC